MTYGDDLVSSNTNTFVAKTINVGGKTAFQFVFIWVGCVILIATTIGILASAGVSSDVYGWIGPIGVLVGVTLTVVMAFRHYYIHYDGTILVAQRPFRTVRKLVNPTGHIFGPWKRNYLQQTVTVGPMVAIDCDNGTLSIACMDPTSAWFRRLNSKDLWPMAPDFIVSLEDFGELLAALNIINMEELHAVEKLSAQAEDMYLDELF